MNRQSPVSTPGETHLTSPTQVDLQHGTDAQGITALHSAEPPCPALALGAFKKNRLVPRLLVPLPKLLLAPMHGTTCEDTLLRRRAGMSGLLKGRSVWGNLPLVLLHPN